MCKRTMYKRARIPMFLWERRACANSGAQAVFPRPRKKRPGNEAKRLCAQRRNASAGPARRARADILILYLGMRIRMGACRK